MKSRLLVPAIFAVAIMIGCVETTSVEAPDYVYPLSSFQVTVNTIVTDSSMWGVVGELYVLLPTQWTVESVYSSSYGISHPFALLGWPGVEDFPCYAYPPAYGYGWFQTRTSELDTLSYYLGDTGSAVVTIIVNDTLGVFQLAFLAAVYDMQGGFPQYEGCPCSCVVEIVPLNLEQETWASIKSELGQ